MKTIAIANQKGGMGKTTVTYNMAVAMTNQGKKVLCVDLDPQQNLSTYMGYDPKEGDVTVMTLLEQAVQMNGEGVYYIPSDIKLSGADMKIAGAFMREQALKND